MQKLGRLDSESKGQGINVVKWMEMVTFDTLGEMAFGESFGCVDREEHHEWIDLILNHLLEITLVDNLRRFPVVAALGRLLLPSLTVAVRNKHSNEARRKVKLRLEADTTRQDFLTNLVSKVKSGALWEEELTAHASTLMYVRRFLRYTSQMSYLGNIHIINRIAGGETTATCLAAASYYLLKTPKALETLVSEIRSRYKTYEEIDAKSAMQLPYLQAVLNESLRIYPPGSQGFPRISPGCEIDGYWVPKGTEVYTSAFTVTHDAKYFHEPESFVPERWLDLDCTDVKEASQPFSLGYRACIGRKYVVKCASLPVSYFYNIRVLTSFGVTVSRTCKWHLLWLRCCSSMTYHFH